MIARHSARALFVCLAFPSLALAAEDSIFTNGFGANVLIEGHVGYPAPLAGAQVEARAGTAHAITASAADGSYRLAFEVDQLQPDAIVELRARGQGDAASQEWTSTLGPVSLVLARAGADAQYQESEDPLLRLGPRSTALAAWIRAFNDDAAVTDEATFWRAVRGRQLATTNLTWALAIVARGGMPLPTGASTTWDAIATRAAATQLDADFKALAATQDCETTPESAYCVVLSGLSLDAAVYPPLAWTEGESYSTPSTFSSGAFESWAFEPSAGGANVLPANDSAVPATVTPLADGGYELAPADGGVFYSEPREIFVDGQYLNAVEESSRVYVRLTRGSGGQVEVIWSRDLRTRFPDNPEVSTRYQEYERYGLPMPSSSNPLPAALQARTPTLQGARWAIPSPLTSPPDDISFAWEQHRYDVHPIPAAGTSGVAERSGQPFEFTAQSPTGFTVSSGGRQVVFKFFNEESPGIWRLTGRLSGSGVDAVLDALLMPVDAKPLTTPLVVASWKSHVNGHVCSGPYGELGHCDNPVATFNADGTAVRTPGTRVGTWSLRPDGRMLFDWMFTPSGGQPFIYDRRGWELVHVDDRFYWMLEDMEVETEDSPPPPVTFKPTSRLIPYARQ